MPRYMLQFSYSPQAVKAMAEKPSDRRAVAAEVVGAAGGKLIDFYLCFGDYDGITIMELPSNVDAAAVALAAGSSGAFLRIETTVLLTPDESMEAMARSGQVAGYAGRGLV